MGLHIWHLNAIVGGKIIFWERLGTQDAWTLMQVLSRPMHVGILLRLSGLGASDTLGNGRHTNTC